MSGSTPVAMSISVVSANDAVSTSRRPNVAVAHATICGGVAPSRRRLASEIWSAVSTERRRSATGSAAETAVVGVVKVAVIAIV